MLSKDILEFFTLATLLAAIVLYMLVIYDEKIDTSNIVFLYIAIGLNSISFIMGGIFVYCFGIPCDCKKGIFYSLL